VLGALARNRHAIDAATDDGDVKASRLQRGPMWNSAAHRVLDAAPTFRAGHLRPNRVIPPRLR
jgi:hypothetical protein